MIITIHRGNQIGGCITEISTATSRIFIDMGQNLPGNGVPATPEQDCEMVRQLFEHNQKAHQAVLYSHIHEDHTGLFNYVPEGVPQYLGEGAKDLFLIKHNLLVKAAIAANDAKKKQLEADKLAKIQQFRTWVRSTLPQSFSIGDIRITPFFNCHSVYDSYMFLIEADRKRIWHTGDYRRHGYLGKGLIPTLKKYATDIDVLVTEGTMLRSDEVFIHEREVSVKMEHLMSAFKYVFVLASATDIERLASIAQAARRTKHSLYVCSGMMNAAMHLFNRLEGKNAHGLFSFRPHYYSEDRDERKMEQNGFCMVAGSGHLDRVLPLYQQLPQSETLLIYSTWDGYYKDPEQVAINPNYKCFREAFCNVVDIHTSGHADRKTIEDVINTVNPKESIISIHKDQGQTLRSLDLNEGLGELVVE